MPRNVELARGAMLLEVGRARSNSLPPSLDKCGPLGGNLAQALLFSRTTYGCSPQCLLPASSLEVKVSEPGRERNLLASLGVDAIRNHPSRRWFSCWKGCENTWRAHSKPAVGPRPGISDLAHLGWGLSICNSNKLPVLLPLLVQKPHSKRAALEA